MAEVLSTGTLPESENLYPATEVVLPESSRLLPRAPKAELLARKLAGGAGKQVREMRGTVGSLRATVRRQMTAIENWRPEHPITVAMRCAGAAFLVGVAIRAWRSNHE